MIIKTLKKIIMTALAVLPVYAMAQNAKYLIQGTIGTYNSPAKVYLQYMGPNNGVVIDSSNVVNGAFSFTGSIASVPIQAYLLFNPEGSGLSKSPDMRPFYIEQGVIQITTENWLGYAKVAGTKTNVVYDQYRAAQQPLAQVYKAMDDKLKAATGAERVSPEFIRQTALEKKNANLLSAEIDRKFILAHPDSYVSLNVMDTYAYSADYADIKPLFDALSPDLKKAKTGMSARSLEERMPKLKAVAMGAIAPGFTEKDTAGKDLSLSSFLGKYVLVDFWASWCVPCRVENQNVLKVYNKYKGENFTILGVSRDTPAAKAAWFAAIKKDGLTWHHVIDSRAADLYGVLFIPQNFLLDPNGKIIGKNMLGVDLEHKLSELFGKRD